LISSTFAFTQAAGGGTKQNKTTATTKQSKAKHSDIYMK